MQFLTLDFETYWDEDYTLKKLTTEAYVRDPRFEVLCCGFRMPDGRPKAISQGARLSDFLQTIDWEQTALLCHHAHFDGLILSHHFGIRPKLWLDSLSMARMAIGNHLSASLESLVKHFGLAPKTVPYDAFKGKHWHELTREVQQQLLDGSMHDCNLTWGIFNRMVPDFPGEEYAIVDMTVRMFTEPQLVGDIDLMADIWLKEVKRKRSLLQELGVDKKTIMSNEGFADLLRAEGIEPATKQGTGKMIYAFAKTDWFMEELLELDDDDPAHMLAEARIDSKSTMTQRRMERLGYMAGRGPLCVYIAYAAAHTSRWGGGDKTNFQNMRRKGRDRETIMAPP